MADSIKSEIKSIGISPFDTPVLFIIFNRPDTTRQVFEAIRQQKPKHFFVAADGPRSDRHEDIEKCNAAREIIQVDWDCDFYTLYSDTNRGCGKGPSEAISWFFKNVEQGIIIEDDSIPAPDFFKYAEILLHKYKDDSRIKVIGSMHLDGNRYGDGSYYFSMMNRNLCAWATWKRVWAGFDYYLNDVTEQKFHQELKNYNVRLKESEYWCARLKEIHSDRLGESSWDIQFLMAIWLNNGIGICPNVNLSTNIGFDEQGTHTKSPDSKAANLSTGSILPLVHPTKIVINRRADLNYHKLYFQPMEYGISGFKRLPYRINRRLKKLLNHQGPWVKK